MENRKAKMGISIRQTVSVMAGVLALAGVIIEFSFRMTTEMTAVQFFSYFTIQSNLLVAVYCFSSLVRRPFLLNSSGFFGLALLNITLTGIIYFILLRGTYPMEGIAVYSNMLLHYVTPPAALLLFFLGREREPFRFHYIFYWILYTLAYLVYSLVRGSVIGTYPYPFIDLTIVTPVQAALNVAGIAAAFALVALLLVLVDRRVIHGRGGLPAGT
jgi:hypothetical protein